ncbi:Na(+)/H(+) antiporter NhaA [Reticulibacter mediterranei]|uniref:Na(+)/H(+) antiporter NhaA n=1 Tax=Reticulibacter mediterranei TaxID=2778369 RepID=A0A8J3ID48_9CHLR|nr:Na+/H+ antiporter NhaA [Reticulibacter mediterranei]GHO90245.1 Na(+)/H(+) antiporter NhaA [Reticulibacter mediterranei]
MKTQHQRSQSAQNARITRLILRPFQEFVQAETASGLLLFICLLIAFLWANSPWSASYAHLLEIHLTIGVGSLLLDHPLHTWINDGLMAIFFLLVGLELKREVLVGELSSPRQATLPLLAAVGGALFPAMIYLIWNGGTGGARGWAIPMATDIAFALAILTLMGRSLPPALKVFLSALAIADDLIAVLIIALFYTQGLNWMALGVAGVAVTGLFLLRGMRQHRLLPYVLLGFLLWAALFHSGVHATIAGVVLAFLLPARSRLDLPTFVAQAQALLSVEADAVPSTQPRRLLDEEHQSAVHALETACEEVQAPLGRMEHLLQRSVAFVIVPLFAFANAGVHLEGTLDQLLTPVSLGVALGLLIGKPIGIVFVSWLLSRCGLAQLPEGVNFRHLLGVGMLAGIGFTMSLFLADLAFEDIQPQLLTQAKLGILAAGVLAAGLGALILRLQRSGRLASG